MVDHGRGEEAHRTECHLDRRGGGGHGVLVLEHLPGGLDEGRLQHLQRPQRLKRLEGLQVPKALKVLEALRLQRERGGRATGMQ